MPKASPSAIPRRGPLRELPLDLVLCHPHLPQRPNIRAASGARLLRDRHRPSRPTDGIKDGRPVDRPSTVRRDSLSRDARRDGTVDGTAVDGGRTVSQQVSCHRPNFPTYLVRAAGELDDAMNYSAAVSILGVTWNRAVPDQLSFHELPLSVS
ncbi:hypothetical protein B0H14DRAFT_285495 [Mycena olivaceomarginata]|jgi:hypothetical protein|nr:hypothetical protein B0H14DRAFT_285495 [Mycena olivaceomarginata]